MLGILCGLESEAKIARQIDGAIVACAAARPHKARELAQELVAKGATRLMSFGIAGALDTSIELGDVVIGTQVVSSTGQWGGDEAWGKTLADKIPHAKRGEVYGSETLVPTAAEKAMLHHKTGCAIVDMESQCVAEVAAEAKIPLIVVRTVCDGATMNVPPLVLVAISESGRVDVIRAIASILHHPMQVTDLFHVARGTSKALTALRRLRSAF